MFQNLDANKVIAGAIIICGLGVVVLLSLYHIMVPDWLSHLIDIMAGFLISAYSANGAANKVIQVAQLKNGNGSGNNVPTKPQVPPPAP